jgi:hypothetical protein
MKLALRSISKQQRLDEQDVPFFSDGGRRRGRIRKVELILPCIQMSKMRSDSTDPSAIFCRHLATAVFGKIEPLEALICELNIASPMRLNTYGHRYRHDSDVSECVWVLQAADQLHELVQFALLLLNWDRHD